MTPDINVLIAAARSDHPHHQIALDWLNQAIDACQEGGRIEILPMTAAGFLRLCTHPKIFQHPTPIKDATAFIDALLAIPGVEMPELGSEWPLFAELCRSKKLTANDIPDAGSLSDLGDRSEASGKLRTVFRSFEENSRRYLTKRIGKMDQFYAAAVDQSLVRQAPRSPPP